MTKDMTSGSPFKCILVFVLPLYLGNLLQQGYSIINSVIVGQYLGVNALAAVGATLIISFLATGFCGGLATGFSIPIAQAFGAKDWERMKKLCGNIATLSVILSVAFTVPAVLLCKQIVTLMRTPQETFSFTEDYLRIIFLGIPAVFIFNAVAGLIRAVGDSKTPFYIQFISGGIHVILAFVFVRYFGWGIAGAGWAMLLSQMFSMCAAILMLVKKFPMLHFSKQDLRPRARYTMPLLKIGLPIGLQFFITGFGTLMVQSAVNGLGAVSVAALSAGTSLNSLIGCGYDTLGAALATYAGQNLGAGRIRRLRKGLRAALICAFVFTGVAISISFLLGRTMAQFFVDPTEIEIIQSVTNYIRINSLFYVLLALVNLLRFMLQGLGYSKIAMLAGVFETGARMVIALVIVPLFGFIGSCFSNPLAWLLADAFLIPVFIKTIKRIEQTVPEARDKPVPAEIAASK